MHGLPRGYIKNILKPVWHDQPGHMPGRKPLWSPAGMPLHPAPGQFPWRSERMRRSQNAPRCPCRPIVLPAGAQDSAPHCFMSGHAPGSHCKARVAPSALVHHSYPGSPPQMRFARPRVWSSSRSSLKPEVLSFLSLHVSVLSPLPATSSHGIPE